MLLRLCKINGLEMLLNCGDKQSWPTFNGNRGYLLVIINKRNFLDRHSNRWYRDYKTRVTLDFISSSCRRNIRINWAMIYIRETSYKLWDCCLNWTVIHVRETSYTLWDCCLNWAVMHISETLTNFNLPIYWVYDKHFSKHSCARNERSSHCVAVWSCSQYLQQFSMVNSLPR